MDLRRWKLEGISVEYLLSIECVALFDYAGQEGDLSFQQGDVITIIKQEADSEWWEGSLNGQQGMFPANYVELRESSAVSGGVVSQQVVEPTSTTVCDVVTGPIEHVAQVSKKMYIVLKKWQICFGRDEYFV